MLWLDSENNFFSFTCNHWVCKASTGSCSRPQLLSRPESISFYLLSDFSIMGHSFLPQGSAPQLHRPLLLDHPFLLLSQGPEGSSYCSYYLCLFISVANQGLAHAQQVLYHWATPSAQGSLFILQPSHAYLLHYILCIVIADAGSVFWMLIDTSHSILCCQFPSPHY
jgi:hypothetical protein